MRRRTDEPRGEIPAPLHGMLSPGQAPERGGCRRTFRPAWTLWLDHALFRVAARQRRPVSGGRFRRVHRQSRRLCLISKPRASMGFDLIDACKGFQFMMKGLSFENFLRTIMPQFRRDIWELRIPQICL